MLPADEAAEAVVVATQDPPAALGVAIEAMDAFVAGGPADPAVRIETTGTAVQMRACFDRGALYPPFPDPPYVLTGPRGLAVALDLLLAAAEQVPNRAQGLYLGLLWRELCDHLPPGWAPPTGRP